MAYIQCPDCDRALHGRSTCPCGWYDASAPIAMDDMDAPDPAPVPPKWSAPSAKVMQLMLDAARQAKRTLPYWKPAIVTTSAQVAHIVRQAQHFGQGSMAARFLLDCKDAGVITDDNLLARAE